MADLEQPIDPSIDMPARPEIDVFGFKLNPMVKKEFLDFVTWHVRRGRRVLVTHLNLHGMAVMYQSATMTRLMKRHDAIVTVDGMSLVFLSRLAGHKLSAQTRVTSLDYIDEMLERAVINDWTIYYVGGREEMLRKGLDHFRTRYPGLKIFGHTGYFDIHDFSADSVQGTLIADINTRKCDLLIVGMGMPRQEEWIDAIRDRVNTTVVISIGAMLEYFAGWLPMPPRWLGPLGLEWMFRLATAPDRLAFRYLVEPFVLFRRLRRGARPPGQSGPGDPE